MDGREDLERFFYDRPVPIAQAGGTVAFATLDPSEAEPGSEDNPIQLDGEADNTMASLASLELGKNPSNTLDGALTSTWDDPEFVSGKLHEAAALLESLPGVKSVVHVSGPAASCARSRPRSPSSTKSRSRSRTRSPSKSPSSRCSRSPSPQWHRSPESSPPNSPIAPPSLLSPLDDSAVEFPAVADDLMMVSPPPPPPIFQVANNNSDNGDQVITLTRACTRDFTLLLLYSGQ